MRHWLLLLSILLAYWVADALVKDGSIPLRAVLPPVVLLIGGGWWRATHRGSGRASRPNLFVSLLVVGLASIIVLFALLADGSSVAAPSWFEALLERIGYR